MPTLLKSTVLGLGLLVGVAASAYAQSVSALPPATPTPTAVAPQYSATKIHPSPGGSQVWQQDPNQPTAAYRLYPLPGSSTSAPASQYQRVGPKPN